MHRSIVKKLVIMHCSLPITGNLGRYINNSCNPNLVMHAIRCPGSMVPQLALFTRKNIPCNEELTFNYGNPNMADDQTPRLGDRKCACKDENCLGFLPYHGFQFDRIGSPKIEEQSTTVT